MKRITITLTEDQAKTLFHVLDVLDTPKKVMWHLYRSNKGKFHKALDDLAIDDFNSQAPYAFVRRIRDKINAELVN